MSKPIRLQGQHAKPLCHDRSYTIAWLPSMYTSRLAFQEVFTTLRLLIIKFMHALFNILHVCLHLIWCSICYFACRQNTSFEHRNGAHIVGTIFIKTIYNEQNVLSSLILVVAFYQTFALGISLYPMHRYFYWTYPNDLCQSYSSVLQMSVIQLVTWNLKQTYNTYTHHYDSCAILRMLVTLMINFR